MWNWGTHDHPAGRNDGSLVRGFRSCLLRVWANDGHGYVSVSLRKWKGQEQRNDQPERAVWWRLIW